MFTVHVALDQAQVTIDFFLRAYCPNIYTVHIGEKNFKCKKCDMAFACNSLRHHHNQKVHEGVEFHCDACGKDFAFKKGLQRNMLTVHEGKKDFECKMI